MPLQLEDEAPNEKTSNTLTTKTSAIMDFFSASGHVSAKDRMLFTEQLSLLLETNNNLRNALSAIKRQTANKSFRNIIDIITNDITEGKSLSMALARHKTIFSSTYINLIAASENGGFLHEVLKQLLDMDEKRENLRSTLASAFSYPAFLIFFSLAVVIFVLTVVFPKFQELFNNIRDQLPISTLFLMWASEVIRLYWIYLLTGIGLITVALYHWTHSPNGKLRIDHIKLTTPIIKDIYIKLYLVQTLQVMSLSISNGVSIMETLQACRSIIHNSLFQKFIHNVETRIQEGNSISLGFQESVFIPDIAKQMISTGDEVGNLPMVMSRLAGFYERELTRRLQMLSRLAEPVMLLVMGGVVGILVSSLILPIFKLSRVVH